MAEYANQRKPQVEDFLFQLVYSSPYLRLFNQSWNTEFTSSITFTGPGGVTPNVEVDKPGDGEALVSGAGTWTSAAVTDGTDITRELVRGQAQLPRLMVQESLGGAQLRQILVDALATKVATGRDTEGGTLDTDAVDPRLRAVITGATYPSDNTITVGTDGTTFIAPPSGNSPPAVTQPTGTNDGYRLVREGLAEALYSLRVRQLIGGGVTDKYGPGAPRDWVLLIPGGLEWIMNQWLSRDDQFQFMAGGSIQQDATLDMGIRGTRAFAGMFPLLDVDVMVDLDLPNATNSTEWAMYLLPAGSRAMWAGYETIANQYWPYETRGDGIYADRAQSIGRLSHKILQNKLLYKINIKQN